MKQDCIVSTKDMNLTLCYCQSRQGLPKVFQVVDKWGNDKLGETGKREIENPSLRRL